MADLLTSDEDRAAAQNAGYGIADCGLAAGMWGNKFVADLASDVETLQARVEALSAALRDVVSYIEQELVRSYSELYEYNGGLAEESDILRELRKRLAAARKALEGKQGGK